MIFKLNKIIIFIIFIFFNVNTYGEENNFNRIEILVNDKIITKYDIVQRLKINAILNRLEINDNNYSQLVTSVIDDLIVEKLKNEKIEEYNITFNEDEFSRNEERFYSSINYQKEELESLFLLNNIDYDNLKEFIEIELKWQKVIYGLYLRITSVTEQEIFDLISKNPNINEEIASELIMQKQLDIKSKKLIKDLRDEATVEYK
tara:strand:+ start:4269 stop:4880 length:612 start_codon:yes stop_codon:yes gene_type:complete